MTELRRGVFRLSQGRGRWLDRYLRDAELSPDKERAWFAGQYQHPHESKHTIGEVLRWFEGAGLEFVRGIRSVQAHGDIDGAPLFEPEPPGTSLDHFVSQAKQIASGNREGGFYVMTGRRPHRDGVRARI